MGIQKKIVYSTEEMRKLFDSVEEKLDEKDREIVLKMLENFNGLIRCAIKQKEYIKSHEKEYVDNMKQNHQLMEDNKKLKDKIERLEIHKKSLLNELLEIKGKCRKYKIEI